MPKGKVAMAQLKLGKTEFSELIVIFRGGLLGKLLSSEILKVSHG